MEILMIILDIHLRFDEKSESENCETDIFRHQICERQTFRIEYWTLKKLKSHISHCTRYWSRSLKFVCRFESQKTRFDTAMVPDKGSSNIH